MELLDIVDEAGEPTGLVKERTRVHREDCLHRTSHVWLARMHAGVPELLLQKRSPGKDSHPGCYDISSAGHIPAGCGYVASALRELQEELGLLARREELIFCGVRRIRWQGAFYGHPFLDNQVTRVYLLWRDAAPASLHLQADEVSEVRWMPLETVVAGVRENRFPNCIAPEELEMVRQVVRRGPAKGASAGTPGL